MNDQRVYTMAKLAIFEEEHKEQLDGARGYFRSDYIGRRLIRTWILTTAACILMLIGWALLNLSVLISDITKIDFLSLGYRFLFLYILIETVMLVLTYIIYSIRYGRAETDLEHYQDLLRELEKSYELEEEKQRVRQTIRKEKGK